MYSSTFFAAREFGVAEDEKREAEGTRSSWTFLSNYAHVLVCLARDPDARLRDIAERVGITERSAFNIVDELERAGVVTRIREGRRNHYEIHRDVPLRHPLEDAKTVGGLLTMLLGDGDLKDPS